MAYNPCAQFLGANIAPNCANQQKSEFTGMGVLIDLGNTNPVVTASADNPRILTDITLAENEHSAVVENLVRDPFSGAARTLNAESGRPSYDLTLPIRIPNVDADKAKDVVEPLAKSHFLGIFPTTDKKFLVYGYYGKFQASEQTMTIADNGGDALATMSSNEPYFYCELKASDYAATKAIYDALVAKAY